MENIPIKQTFVVVRWWTSLKLIDKLMSFLVAVILSLSTVSIRLSATNATLQKENLNMIVECERRNLTTVTTQRNHDDSLRAQDKIDCEIEKNAIYGRVPIIENRNRKIENALK